MLGRRQYNILMKRGRYQVRYRKTLRRLMILRNGSVRLKMKGKWISFGRKRRSRRKRRRIRKRRRLRRRKRRRRRRRKRRRRLRRRARRKRKRKRRRIRRRRRRRRRRRQRRYGLRRRRLRRGGRRRRRCIMKFLYRGRWRRVYQRRGLRFRYGKKMIRIRWDNYLATYTVVMHVNYWWFVLRHVDVVVLHLFLPFQTPKPLHQCGQMREYFDPYRLLWWEDN